MPIYAYCCEACGHAKDVLRKVSDPLLTTCPACGAEAFKKQLTAAGFQLKGSGWYVTDFKGDSKAAKPAGEDAASTASKGDGDNGSAGAGEATQADAVKAEGSKGDTGRGDIGKGDANKGDTNKAGNAAAKSPAPAPTPAAPASGAGGSGTPATGK